MSLTSYRAAPPRVKGYAPPRITDDSIDKEKVSVLGRPGDDLLSHVLRQSTIGAKAFDGRVRDGIGSDRLARATRPAKDGYSDQSTVISDQKSLNLIDLVERAAE